MAAYADDKARIYSQVRQACVYNADDPATERMVEDAEVVEGARAIGFTLGIPAVSMLGVVDDLLVDRAFISQRRDSAIELAKLSDVMPQAPHNVANALAAAALARSFGVPPAAVAEGLKRLRIGDHRIQTIAEVAGVRYVDDSKATNPHAAEASLAAFDNVVWIAGGQAKGTTFDDLVARVGPRLRAAAVLGVDRRVIADALSRHAPEVPVNVLDSVDHGAMHQAVEWAATQARPGDVVLLAPGCASKDMYTDYAARGDDFAAAVTKLSR
jgi:UDP-N-acetylmuramoylalanine--D-glutamate ligase